MKHISRWASKHVGCAVLLIIICETANAVNGLLLGMNLLNGWPTGILWVLVVGLLAGAVLVQKKPAVGKTPYGAGRTWLFGAFLGNFMLFCVLGGLWTGQAAVSGQPVWGSSQTVIRSDTLAPVSRPRSASGEDYYVERTTRQPGQTGTRIAFVLLFGLGIFLAGAATVLSCQLACAGNGALAFLVLLLGIVSFGGGFFFLSRAFEKVIKPWQQMSRFERRRVNLRALFLLLGFYALTLLLGRLGG